MEVVVVVEIVVVVKVVEVKVVLEALLNVVEEAMTVEVTVVVVDVMKTESMCFMVYPWVRSEIGVIGELVTACPLTPVSDR